MRTSNSRGSASRSEGAAGRTRRAGASGKSSSEGLRELFVLELKDIYWAEKALTKAIPKMIKKAGSEELVAALEEHLSVTEEQVSRVEECFKALGLKPQAKKCEAMEGLISEGEEMMDELDGIVRDAAIIAASQKIEHYEIASYGTLCSFARSLGETEVMDILDGILQEEKDADSKLTEIAEASINEEALSAEAKD